MSNTTMNTMKMSCLAFVVVAIVIITASSSKADGETRSRGTVSEKPNIFQRPQSQTVHEYQLAKFVCRVRSKLPMTLSWFHNDRKLSNMTGSVLLINDTLILPRVQKLDEGVYKCVAKNDAGTSSSETKLKVLDPLMAPVITQISSNLTILEGKRVTFTCKAKGNPSPEIKWKRRLGNVMDTRFEQPSPGSIRILSANSRNSGQYMCVAVNTKGNDTRVLYLKVLGYPVFLVSPPANLTVQENVTVSLDCKVTGFPIPEVTWYFENHEVQTVEKTIVLKNNTLIMKAVYFEDSGIYTCVANNSVGLRRSKRVFLRVLRRPKWLCCPDKIDLVKKQTAINGQNPTLDCSAPGYPEPNYSWVFKNVTVSQQHNFTITNVSVTDEGLYFCNVSNKLGSLMVKIFLSILVVPKVSVEPEQAIVLPGQTVQFKCKVSGNPVPKISWYSYQEKISQNDTLVINNVTTENEVEYLCKGESLAGKSVAKATLIVAVLPTFDEPPRNITDEENSSVFVHCSAKGPNKPVINWYRLTTGGKKISISTNERISIDIKTLEISQLKRNDSGLYLCEAKNYAGVANITFFIDTQYSPYVIPFSTAVDIVVGRKAVLHCPIMANPEPRMQWTVPVLFDGADLVILEVNSSHEGKYICNGFNKYGEIQATFQVTVLTPPLIIGLKKVNRSNNWISLSCETKGNPKASVLWSSQMPLQPGSFSIDSGNLQLNRQFISKMNFICNATNDYGWTFKYVRVPSSPQHLRSLNVTSTTATFSWVLNKTEIFSQIIIERLSKDDLTWTAIKTLPFSEVYTCRGLEPFSWFAFRTKAMNALGVSGPSGTLNITTIEGVPSKPTYFIVILRELTAVTVVWKLPDEPRGQLTNILYEVYYSVEAQSFAKKELANNSTTAGFPVKITNLKSNVMYVIKVRAGRKGHGGVVVKWSAFEFLKVKTLQSAPTVSPEVLKVESNGPRRIFISWKRAYSSVDGYKLRYAEYESNNNETIIIQIESWNSTNYIITGLMSGKYYEIQVKMFTSGGGGPWSIPVVIRTDQDNLSSFNSSDGLPWKIALAVSIVALVLLSVVLAYIYFTRRNTTNTSSVKQEKKSRKKDRYDLDNASQQSNDSEGTIHGIYNVNMENDIDLSMFTGSNHSNPVPVTSALYVENPILPSHDVDSDDSYEAVKLATFTTRPSPLPTPGGSPYNTTRREMVERDIESDYAHPDPPIYAKVDFTAKEKERQSGTQQLDQLTDDILI